jgi:hypothetical protein
MSVQPLEADGRWFVWACCFETGTGVLEPFVKSFNASMDLAFLDRYNSPLSFPTLCAPWLSGEDVEVGIRLRGATPDSLSLLPPRNREVLCPKSEFASSAPLLSLPNRPNTFLKPFACLNKNVLLRFEGVDDALSFPNKLVGSEGENGE